MLNALGYILPLTLHLLYETLCQFIYVALYIKEGFKMFKCLRIEKRRIKVTQVDFVTLANLYALNIFVRNCRQRGA